MYEVEKIRTPQGRKTVRVKMRATRQRCDGSKLIYRNWRGAERAARRMRRTKSKDGGRITVYRCESCRGYHLGSQQAW
jgi:DNA-directed RNA polymerase subunit M/transcription elongation factor TFIIS